MIFSTCYPLDGLTLGLDPRTWIGETSAVDFEDGGNCRGRSLSNYLTRVATPGVAEDEDAIILTLTVVTNESVRGATVQLIFRCKRSTGVAVDNAEYLRSMLNRHVAPHELDVQFGQIYHALARQPGCHKRWQGKLHYNSNKASDFGASLAVINSCMGIGGTTHSGDGKCPVAGHAHCIGSLDEACRAVAPIYEPFIRSTGVTMSTVTFKRPYFAPGDLYLSNARCTHPTMVLVFEPKMGKFAKHLKLFEFILSSR